MQARGAGPWALPDTGCSSIVCAATSVSFDRLSSACLTVLPIPLHIDGEC